MRRKTDIVAIKFILSTVIVNNKLCIAFLTYFDIFLQVLHNNLSTLINTFTLKYAFIMHINHTLEYIADKCNHYICHWSYMYISLEHLLTSLQMKMFNITLHTFHSTHHSRWRRREAASAYSISWMVPCRSRSFRCRIRLSSCRYFFFFGRTTPPAASWIILASFAACSFCISWMNMKMLGWGRRHILLNLWCQPSTTFVVRDPSFS